MAPWVPLPWGTQHGAHLVLKEAVVPWDPLPLLSAPLLLVTTMTGAAVDQFLGLELRDIDRLRGPLDFPPPLLALEERPFPF